MTDRDIRRLEQLIGIAERLTILVPAARLILRAEAAINDGFPTTASGADRGSGGRGERTIAVPIIDEHGHPLIDTNGRPIVDHVPVTSVEAAVLATERVHYSTHAIDNQLDDAARALTTLERECRRLTGILPPRADIKRCDSTGRDGTIEWADPTCTTVASRGPLCDRCSKREYRWRTDRNLPARRDGVFAGDLDERVR